MWMCGNGSLLAITIRNLLPFATLFLTTPSILETIFGVEPSAGHFFPSTSAFLVPNLATTSRFDSNMYYLKPVVVVGKIIVDEYGEPYPHLNNSDDSRSDKSEIKAAAPPKSVSIGGGGPQAAFGAAAALAVWDRRSRFTGDNNIIPASEALISNSTSVIFVAPVGKDWTESETTALKSSLGASTSVVVHTENSSFAASQNDPSKSPDFPIIQTHLIRSGCNKKSEENNGFFTPRIRMWHDQDQKAYWYPLNDSFGADGADGLWRNNPSAEDLASIIEANKQNGGGNGVILHGIAEAWTGAAGGRLDFLPLIENRDFLQRHLSFVGIEPVASGESVTTEDAEVAASILHSCCETVEALSPAENSVFWCPDRDLDQTMEEHDLYQGNNGSNILLAVATRDGPRGSLLKEPLRSQDNECSPTSIPAASLRTNDGDPIDPTGAGNAYSGAMTALLGNGVKLTTAACIASGVGAVVCEHEGLPPASDWSLTINRIEAAAREVEASLVESDNR